MTKKKSLWQNVAARLQPASAQAGKPVPPGIDLSDMRKTLPLNEFCKRLKRVHKKKWSSARRNGRFSAPRFAQTYLTRGRHSKESSKFKVQSS
jgi:hypothetical protein